MSGKNHYGCAVNRYVNLYLDNGYTYLLNMNRSGVHMSVAGRIIASRPPNSAGSHSSVSSTHSCNQCFMSRCDEGVEYTKPRSFFFCTFSTGRASPLFIMHDVTRFA